MSQSGVPWARLFAYIPLKEHLFCYLETWNSHGFSVYTHTYIYKYIIHIVNVCKKEPCFRWPKNSACLLLFSLRTLIFFSIFIAIV